MSPSQMVLLTLAIPAICYIGSVAGYLSVDRPGMAVAFAGYAVANVGFAWDLLRPTGVCA